MSVNEATVGPRQSLQGVVRVIKPDLRLPAFLKPHRHCSRCATRGTDLSKSHFPELSKVVLHFLPLHARGQARDTQFGPVH